jgi:ubiquinone/menaquinone biosynthesis C-methylase UbiE
LEHQARVAKLFDQLADTYDAVGVDFFQPIASGLVTELAPRPGEQAVDIGCGRGAVLVPLATAIGPTGSVIGLDLSPRMVEIASAAVVEAGLAVEVRMGDAMAPELPSDSFDLVASSLVLFFLPDPLAALRSWRALLVAGGRVGVSTFGPYSELWRDRVDAVLRAHVPPGVADARTTGQQGPFASDEGMESLLRGAGFRGVRTVLGTVQPRFENADQWFRWSMSTGQRQFWEAIPESERVEVQAAAFAAAAACRDELGRIGFDQQIRYTIGVR